MWNTNGMLMIISIKNCGIYYIQVLDATTPWLLRCPIHCNNRQSVITPTCFLNGTKKYYSVFKALYMWVWEYPPKTIVRESGLSKQTVSTLNNEWREICEYENELEDELEGPMVGNGSLIETDETAFGKRKYNRGKRQRKGGVQWAQTILQVKENSNGTRTATKLREKLVADRTAATIQENLINEVDSSSRIQSDCEVEPVFRPAFKRSFVETKNSRVSI